MKTIFFLTMLCLSTASHAQTKIEKRIPTTAGQTLAMEFDYPELIRVSTWDKNEILITGDVSINKGENDDAFELKTSQVKNEILVSSHIKNMDKLPKRIVIKKGDTEYFFQSTSQHDPAVRKFLDENGADYTYISTGVQKDITLDIKVPRNMKTTINATYGLVEIVDFKAPLVVTAKYGGVDASISSSGLGELTARTQFGEILTNLDIKFDSSKDEGDHKRWTVVSAKPGQGPRYDLESRYGKVYLRKPKV